MGRVLSESLIVREIAERVCRSIARTVIRELQQKRNSLLSGDDSGLENAWDELCVQVQGGESFYWDCYEETVNQIVTREVNKLTESERDDIWLQTPSGEAWVLEAEHRDFYPVDSDEIVEFITAEYVFDVAGEWSNKRIRDFLYR